MSVFQDLRILRNNVLKQMVQEECSGESGKSPRKSTSVQRHTQIHKLACTSKNTLFQSTTLAKVPHTNNSKENNSKMKRERNKIC